MHHMLGLDFGLEIDKEDSYHSPHIRVTIEVLYVCGQSGDSRGPESGSHPCGVMADG